MGYDHRPIGAGAGKVIPASPVQLRNRPLLPLVSEGSRGRLIFCQFTSPALPAPFHNQAYGCQRGLRGASGPEGHRPRYALQIISPQTETPEMANNEDLARIRQGVAVWNDWRAQNPAGETALGDRLLDVLQQGGVLAA